MVALQILVLSVWVRILVGQQNGTKPCDDKVMRLFYLKYCYYFCLHEGGVIIFT